MRKAVTTVETQLQRIVTDAESRWATELTEGVGQIRQKVDDGLASQTRAVGDLPGKIDDKAHEIQDQSWWERALSFLGGFIMGFLESLGEFLLTVLKIVLVVLAVVVVLALVVVVLALLAPELLAAIVGAVIAVAAVVAPYIGAIVTGLLIAGAVLIVGMALFKFWQAWSRDDLSPYERGKLVGSGTFDIVTIVFGARIAAWLGRLFRPAAAVEEGAEAARLARLRGLVQDEALLNRLTEMFGGDLARLEELLGLVGNDSAELQRLLGVFGNDAAKLEQMIRLAGGDVGRLNRMLEATGGVVKLEELLGRTGGDFARLERFLAATNNDVARLEQLLTATGNDGPRLEKLLQSAGGDAAKVENLARAVPDPAALERLTDLTNDADQLERLLRAARGNAADLEQMLTKIGGKPKANLLETLFDRAPGNDPAKVADLLNAADGPRLAEAVPKFAPAAGRVATPAAAAAAPTSVGANGYGGADMSHFMHRHTYEFFDFTEGTGGTELSNFLDEALNALHSGPGGRPTPFPPFFKPQPIATLPGGLEVQVGFRGSPAAPTIGQFFPLRGPGMVKFPPMQLMAIKAFFGF
jgi:Tfp pilus assembly protein PilN